jgi:ATP adenylyltransferase
MAHVNLHHARTDFQRDIMRRIQKDKVCPFCEEHFLKYHTKPIIKKGKYWILTENFQPYHGTKHHLLAVSRKHIQSFEKLSAAARNELFSLFAMEVKKRKIPGGGIFMRFGDSDYSGGTVEHLHAQLISGGKRSAKKNRIATTLAYEF